MQEKNLYNTEFFEFFQEIIAYCDIEYIDLEKGVISEKAKELCLKDKRLYTLLTHCIAQLIFRILVKAYNNSVIIITL